MAAAAEVAAAAAAAATAATVMLVAEMEAALSDLAEGDGGGGAESLPWLRQSGGGGGGGGGGCAVALDALLEAAQRTQALLEIERWRAPAAVLTAVTPSASLDVLQLPGGGLPLLPAPSEGRPLIPGSCSSDSVPPSGSTGNLRGGSNGGGSGGGGGEACVPAPRTAGAVFSGAGQLVYFCNSPSPYAGLASTVRTYAEFRSNVQGWRLAPTVRLQLMAGAPAGLATDASHSDDEWHELSASREPPRSPLLPSPVQWALERQQAASKNKRWLAGGGGSSRLLRSLGGQPATAHLWLLDAALLPEQISRELAARYALGAVRTRCPPAAAATAGEAARGPVGGGVAARRAQAANRVCAHNAVVALESGDARLWRSWSLAARALAAAAQAAPAQLLPVPSHHATPHHTARAACGAP